MTLDIYTLLVTMVALAMLIAIGLAVAVWSLYRQSKNGQSRIAALEAENLALRASNAAHAAVLQQFYPNELAQAMQRAQALLGRGG